MALDNIKEKIMTQHVAGAHQRMARLAGLAILINYLKNHPQHAANFTTEAETLERALEEEYGAHKKLIGGNSLYEQKPLPNNSLI